MVTGIFTLSTTFSDCSERELRPFLVISTFIDGNLSPSMPTMMFISTTMAMNPTVNAVEIDVFLNFTEWIYFLNLWFFGPLFLPLPSFSVPASFWGALSPETALSSGALSAGAVFSGSAVFSLSGAFSAAPVFIISFLSLSLPFNFSILLSSTFYFRLCARSET